MSKRRKRHKPKASAAASLSKADKSVKQAGGGDGGGGDSGDSGALEPQEPQESEGSDSDDGSSDAEAPGYEYGYDAPPTPVLPAVRFPITSSHIINGRVRTASVCITPSECKVVHCSSAQPMTSFGAENVAAFHRGTILKVGTDQHYQKQVTELVKRARHGDQNAMAIIALTRDNAMKGNPRAQASVSIMKGFIEQNPVRADNTFGGEDDNEIITPDTAGAIMMANGPPLTNKRMLRIVIAIPIEEDRKLFAHGFSKWRDAHEAEHVLLASRLNSLQTQILRTGRTLGYARAIQRVRNPNMPISTFDKKVGWELGES